VKILFYTLTLVSLTLMTSCGVSGSSGNGADWITAVGPFIVPIIETLK
tara:strand:- start:37150 stop:37293 length:144 start_codon:yes stop_codon:yes gene_type:complete